MTLANVIFAGVGRKGRRLVMWTFLAKVDDVSQDTLMIFDILDRIKKKFQALHQLRVWWRRNRDLGYSCGSCKSLLSSPIVEISEHMRAHSQRFCLALTNCVPVDIYSEAPTPGDW